MSGVRKRPEWERIPCEGIPRGFRCARYGVVQRLWSEPEDRASQAAFWVHVRTRFLAGYDGSPAQSQAHAADMRGASLAAVVPDAEDPTRLQLASSLRVSAENRAWAQDMLAFVALLQASEARRLAWASDLLGLGAWPDLATEPVPRARGEAQDELFDRLASANVGGTNPWSSSDLEAAVELLLRVPDVHAAATPDGLMASFRWTRGPSPLRRALLDVNVKASRPRLGPGVSLVLVPPPDGTDARAALALNQAETAASCRTDLLGGWSVREGLLQFSAFLPDAVHAPGVFPAMVANAARRVEWMLARSASG